MAPKRATISTPAAIAATTTTVTNSQLQAMIDQGVTTALAARDAIRSTNGEDNHNSGTGELALLCVRMFPEESDKIERYVGGLPDMIHGKNKRKQDDNQQQQQQNKRQITGRAYTVGTCKKKPYGGSKPLCAKCKYHHDGPCAPKCHKCNIVGHLASDCRSPANTNASNNQRGTGAGTEAHGMAYALRGGETDQDPNNI
ncbi:putative reverse transcriptase domain-containing protein, partial [Tanacetum coccineum]